MFSRGGGIMISLKGSLPNANHRAYRRLSALIGFRRPLRPGLPGPLGTLRMPIGIDQPEPLYSTGAHKRQHSPILP